MKKLIIISLLSATILPASVFAVDLQTARTQGLVTEQPTGYIAAAKASPEVNKLVEDVNAARTAEYARISKENGQPVDVVAKLAAAQIQQKLGK